jgi:hypothetical protein
MPADDTAAGVLHFSVNELMLDLDDEMSVREAYVLRQVQAVDVSSSAPAHPMFPVGGIQAVAGKLVGKQKLVIRRRRCALRAGETETRQQ